MVQDQCQTINGSMLQMLWSTVTQPCVQTAESALAWGRHGFPTLLINLLSAGKMVAKVWMLSFSFPLLLPAVLQCMQVAGDWWQEHQHAWISVIIGAACLCFSSCFFVNFFIQQTLRDLHFCLPENTVVWKKPIPTTQSPSLLLFLGGLYNCENFVD